METTQIQTTPDFKQRKQKWNYKYKHTAAGYLHNMYSNLKIRGIHATVDVVEFVRQSLNEPSFNEAWTAYVNSGYLRGNAPTLSADSIDNKTLCAVSFVQLFEKYTQRR